MYRAFLTQLDDSLILDDDKCIDKLSHRADTCHSLLKAVDTLVNWRGCQYSDNRNVERVNHLRDYRSCSRTRTTTHTCSKEDKVRITALDILANLRQRLLCLVLTHSSIVSGTLTVTHAYLLRRLERTLIQSLAIGVADHKVYTLNAELKDMIYRITARTTYADDHNLRRHSVGCSLIIFKFVVKSHRDIYFIVYCT